MSEYQCFQWKAVDRVLSQTDRAEVSKLSSHISVSADFAEVEYHWGDFKHDPRGVLARYFDVFFYDSNWGDQSILMQFPRSEVDITTLQKFELPNIITVEADRKHVLLTIDFDENWTDSTEPDKMQRGHHMENLYKQIMNRDYRLLFLAWLKGCEHKEGRADSSSVPLPHGLNQLMPEHQDVIDLIGVDLKLLAAAQCCSPSMSKEEDRPLKLASYFSSLSAEQQEPLLQAFIDGDALTAQRSARTLLKQVSGCQLTRPARLSQAVCYADLKEAKASALELQQRQRKEQARIKKEKFLTELASREAETWALVHQHIRLKKPKEYDQALLLLKGLYQLAVSRDDRATFLLKTQQIRQTYPTLRSLHARLADQGWK